MGKNLKLRAARALKDRSQKEPTDSVGVSRQTINAVESGKAFRNTYFTMLFGVLLLFGLNDVGRQTAEE